MLRASTGCGNYWNWENQGYQTEFSVTSPNEECGCGAVIRNISVPGLWDTSMIVALRATP